VGGGAICEPLIRVADRARKRGHQGVGPVIKSSQLEPAVGAYE